MKQTTTKQKVYYFWWCDPNEATLVAHKVLGGEYKPVEKDRDDKRRAGMVGGFIYHYVEQIVKFEKS